MSTYVDGMTVCNHGDLVTALLSEGSSSEPVRLRKPFHLSIRHSDGSRKEIFLSVTDCRNSPAPGSEPDPPKIADLVRKYREARAKEICPLCAAHIPFHPDFAGERKHWCLPGRYRDCLAIHILDAPEPCITEELGEILHALLWNAEVLR